MTREPNPLIGRRSMAFVLAGGRGSRLKGRKVFGAPLKFPQSGNFGKRPRVGGAAAV